MPLERRQCKEPREPIDRRLEVDALALGRRRGLAGAERFQQVAHVRQLPSERRMLAFRGDGHAGTATDCDGSNDGAGEPKSTRRLSTPSTVSLTHCAPGSTTPRSNVSV